jgi:hypothetical protein
MAFKMKYVSALLPLGRGLRNHPRWMSMRT